MVRGMAGVYKRDTAIVLIEVWATLRRHGLQSYFSNPSFSK
jgi:hypothetical protein